MLRRSDDGHEFVPAVRAGKLKCWRDDAVRADGEMWCLGVVADNTGRSCNATENLAHIVAAAIAENTVERDHLGHQSKVARCYRVAVERRQHEHVAGDDFFTATDSHSAVAGDVVRHGDVEADAIQPSAIGLHL